MKTRVHLVTLGVADLAESLAFYERFGWKKAAESVDGSVVFFQANGFAIGLYPQEKLSEDTGGADAPRPGGITLSQNFASEAAMREALDRFVAAGASLRRAPFAAPWGLIAYAADPDGHLWEFAHVPGFEPDEDGALVLPSERPGAEVQP